MAPPRRPIPELKVVGGYRPNRHADREHVPAPTGELGDPPDSLTEGEREAWAELSVAAPWLTDADRAVTELTAGLMTLCRCERPQAALIAQLQQALGRLGLSPADRRKVLVRPPAEPPSEQSTFAKLAAKRRGRPLNYAQMLVHGQKKQSRH